MTLTEMWDLIRSICLLSNEDISDNDLTAFVNEGQRRIAGMFDWPWLTATSTTSDITGGNPSITLPADFARARTVLLDGEDTKLAEISAEEAWERWGDDLPEGTPRVFWFEGEGLKVAPVPSANTDVKIHYWKNPTDLAIAADEPAFAAQFHGALADWALWRVWQREEDYRRARDHEASFNSALNDMVRFYFNRAPDYPLVFGEPSDYAQRRHGTANMPWLDGV